MNIGVRAGSFCMYELMRNLMGIEDDSHIIQNIENHDNTSLPGLVRASFSIQNSMADVYVFTSAIRNISKSNR